jgi:signal transduction histidine kinase
VRTLSYLLHPPTLSREGLKKTLRGFVRGFAQRTGLTVNVNVRGAVDSLPIRAQRALFRVTQEAIANAHRHSSARMILIDLRRQQSGVRLTVTDDGGGLGRPLHNVQLGVGIPGMEARIQRLGGSFSISSTTSGTQVSACIPSNAAGPSKVSGTATSARVRRPQPRSPEG